MIRKTVFYLHLCLGLLAALFLFVQGVTGSILVFENEIDWTLNRDSMQVQPQAARASLAMVSGAIAKAYPGYQFAVWQLPPRANIAGTAVLQNAAGDSVAIAYDPYTARLIGPVDGNRMWMYRVRMFHKHLWGGAAADAIVGWSSGILLVLSISGLVLWWPKKIRRVKWSAAARRTFDLHNTVGFYSALFLFVFALTGIVIHWDGPSQKLLHRLTRSGDFPAPKKPGAVATGAAELGPQELVSIAEKAIPGATVTTLFYGAAANAPVRVALRFPEDHTPAGRSTVVLDSLTGEAISVRSSRTAPLDFKIVKLWNRQVHTGDIFGWPTRILASLFSLALPVMAFTGPVLWCKRLCRSRTKKQMELGERRDLVSVVSRGD